MAHLYSLDLYYTSVSDAGLDTIKTLTTLHVLNLNGGADRITDAGVQKLDTLRRLTSLMLNNTKATGAAARELHKKIPNCRITWTGGILEGGPSSSPSVTLTFKSPPTGTSVAARSTIDQAIIAAGTPTSETPTTSTTTTGTPSTATTSTTTSTTMPSTAVDVATGASSGPKKLAVPATDAQQAALKTIKEIFADDYTAAKTPDQKGALAVKLLEQAKQTFDDPTSRYLLLSEARALATEASSLETLRDALTPLVEEYDVNEVTTLIDAWTALQKRPRIESATIQQLFKEANARFDQAVMDARFDDAKHYGEFGLTTARRIPNSAASVKLMMEKNTALAARQTEWPALKALADTLKANPDDAAANLAVARYQALVAEDWASAFPLYAKSGDELLVKLAAKSIGDMNNPTAQAAAGDAWWDAAQAAKPPQKSEFLAAAQYWYELAGPLLTGLPKTRVEKRRTELNTTVAARKIPATTLPGFVQASSLASNDTSTNAMPNRNFGDPTSTVRRTTTNTAARNGAPVDERQIAQALIASGGTVNLRIPTPSGSWNYFSVTPRGILPADKFTIESVTFMNMGGVADPVEENDLIPLLSIPNLRSLSIHIRVDSRALRVLRGLQNLESLSFLNTPLTDEDTIHVRGLVNLQNLTFSYCQITDAALSNFRELTNLRTLNLTSTQITGVGFSQLNGLTQLRSLNLFNSPITDAGLLQIQRLSSSVRTLDVTGSAVTDSGMANFRGLTDLENLTLRNTSTTDATLRTLEGRTRLQRVVVSKNMTTAGAQALQKAIPSCRIEFPQ
ncbi:MAG: leucine-rich repeat domain-containing protein [Planctomycetia bacterium]|nr:leucine-rich repeat domain-containing protein [Planctomycetia bacterium]